MALWASAAARRADREIVRLMVKVDGSTLEQVRQTLRLPMKVVERLLAEVEQAERERAASRKRREKRAQARVVKAKPGGRRGKVEVAARRVAKRRSWRAQMKAEIVLEAQKLRSSGMSHKRIAAQLGYPSHTTIRRWLEEAAATALTDPR